ncbi:MAG: hypothetical protein MK364_20520, partial [Pirellulales bacterium]|nr:hypothetical protein [Pirellulales bacterium]
MSGAMYEAGQISASRALRVAQVLAVCVIQLTSAVDGAEYWVAVDGDDRQSGRSREQAWASPSRGQPTRLIDGYRSGETALQVASTDGFLDAGVVIVNGQHRAYERVTDDTIQLTQPFDFDVPVNTTVWDGTILDGRSFAPGDVINLAAGVFVDRSLRVEQPGQPGQPVTYRCLAGQDVVLVPARFNQPGIQVGFTGGGRTAHIVLIGLT